MPPRRSLQRAHHAAPGGAAAAVGAAVQASHELHTALQAALQWIRTSANTQNASLEALPGSMAPLRDRVHAVCFTAAELDALSALVHAGAPSDAWLFCLLETCTYAECQEQAEALAAGRLRQLADTPDLLAASVSLALDTSRCDVDLLEKMECARQMGAVAARRVVSRLADLVPQRLLRVPGGSGLPAAFARAAAAEDGASYDQHICLYGIGQLLDVLVNEHDEQLQGGAAGAAVHDSLGGGASAGLPGSSDVQLWGSSSLRSCYIHIWVCGQRSRRRGEPRCWFRSG